MAATLQVCHDEYRGQSKGSSVCLSCHSIFWETNKWKNPSK